LEWSGRIDLVTSERDYLVFVEVKSCASDEFGIPDRRSTPKKKNHLARAAGAVRRRAVCP
jgi:Holliday junction resolvase-like predicted endonuclease